MKYIIIDDYCTISEIAKILKVTRHTLLHYENENMVAPILRGENGYRYYSGEQLAKFKNILYLRELGFSIPEIKEYLDKNNYTEAISRMETRLLKNSKEIEKLLLKEKQLKEGINSLKKLKKIELHKNLPFVSFEQEIKGSILSQNTFNLKDWVVNMKKIDDIFDNVIWTEKYNFGVLVSKENLISKNFNPDRFFISAPIKNLESYTLKDSLYAILYTDKIEDYSKSIQKLLDWIKENNLIIDGDLFIEDPSTHIFSEKYNPFVKIFKISVKKP